MTSIDPRRANLALVQREFLDMLRGVHPEGERWATEHLHAGPSPAMLGFLRSAARSDRRARLRGYFPRFVTHADLPPAWLASLASPIVTARFEAALDHHFAACLELVEAWPEAAAWRDCLRIERAEALQRRWPASTIPELVAELRTLALPDKPLEFDERGVCDRPGFCFVQLDTTLIDLWLVPERSPREACEWGGPRSAAVYWCPRRQALRVVEFHDLRELALSLALGA